MKNGSARFAVYTSDGLYLAGIRSGEPEKAIHITRDKKHAARMVRGAAVRVLGYLRGAGLSCWLVAL